MLPCVSGRNRSLAASPCFSLLEGRCTTCTLKSPLQGPAPSAAASRDPSEPSQQRAKPTAPADTPLPDTRGQAACPEKLHPLEPGQQSHQPTRVYQCRELFFTIYSHQQLPIWGWGGCWGFYPHRLPGPTAPELPSPRQRSFLGGPGLLPPPWAGGQARPGRLHPSMRGRSPRLAAGKVNFCKWLAKLHQQQAPQNKFGDPGAAGVLIKPSFPGYAN